METPIDGDLVMRRSLIDDFQLCPARIGYKDQPGYVEPVSDALVFGQGLHYLANMHTMQGGPWQGNFEEWLEPYLAEEFDWSIAQIPNYDNFREEVYYAYMRWSLEIWPEQEPYLKRYDDWYAERTLYWKRWEKVDEVPDNSDVGVSAWLSGTPDLYNGMAMVDYKTTGAAWQWYQAKVDLAIQPSMYLALHQHVYGELLPEFVFYVWDRKKKEWLKFVTSRTQAVVDAAVATADQYLEQYAARIFPATMVVEGRGGKKQRGWYCSAKWCPAWNICEHKFLNDSVDESEVAVRGWR